MFRQVILRAPAKVNLSLDITGRREDGYHFMSMVMQTVDLCDYVTITRRESGGITVGCTDPDIPCDESNTAYRAARVFLERTGIQPGGLEIRIDKAIPSQAGLGGGSADAAAVLEGLNQMFGKPLQPREVIDLGVSVGADVPFCLVGGTVLAKGIGEIFTAIPTLSNCYIVIAKPAAGISTAAAFARYDREGCSRRPDVNRMVNAIVSGDMKALGESMCNVLEEVAPFDEVRHLHETFEQCEALGSVMTGSGSAVIGLFDNKRKARNCYRRMMQIAHSVFLTRPEELGVQVIEKL